ncbi:MAG TPA: hypothetical protein VN045_11130, partial [Microbacteriaceae bacterium]|nr:hypothetical protein [Microbacteriaceae bacterium]
EPDAAKTRLHTPGAMTRTRTVRFFDGAHPSTAAPRSNATRARVGLTDSWQSIAGAAARSRPSRLTTFSPAAFATAIALATATATATAQRPNGSIVALSARSKGIATWNIVRFGSHRIQRR